MNVADAIACRSRCVKANVGAVIVTKDQRVASTGYNGPPRGLYVYGPCSEWCPRMKYHEDGVDYSSCESIHAEANAVARADFTQIQGGTIYVSRGMCVNCMRLVANSGIERIVHRVTEEDMHRHPGWVERKAYESGMEIERYGMAS